MGMKTRETQPKQTRETFSLVSLNKEKKTMKTKKATPKKATPKKARKPQAKKSIFSSIRNLASSVLINLVRTESAQQKRIIDVVELAEMLTDDGTPQTAEQVRKRMQKERRKFFTSKEEQKAMRRNGQVQISENEILGWRTETGKPIAYGIEKGKLS
jgi:hypothetical protein